jgi:hypothetical protein
MRSVHFCDRVAQCFVASQRLRTYVLLTFLIVLVGMILSIVINPLKYGLTAQYYDNSEWRGSPLMAVREQDLNLWRIKSEFPDKSRYSIQWTGFIYIPQAGEYEFKTKSDDGSDLSIQNQLVVENSGVHGLQERSGKIVLEQGFCPITVRYMQMGGAAEFKAYWKPPGKNKALLSAAPLFVKKPTVTAFLFGRVLATFRTLCQFLCLIGFVSVALISLSSRHILLPFLKMSWIGKTYLQCRTCLIKDEIEKQEIPVPASKSIIGLLLALVGYTLLTCVWLHPIVLNFSTKMVGLGGDRYIYMWDMWWMKKALVDLHTNPLFTDYVFYPHGINLTFHDFSIFNSLASIPFQAFLTIKEIYNLFFLLTYILGGFGCFLLVRYLTGDQLAAFFSGVVFVFWGGRAYYVDHLSLASIQWFPYCALYLIKTVRERSYRNPVLAAIFLAMNALSAWYYAIYMSLFTGLFLLYTALAKHKTFFTVPCLKRIVLLGLLFLVILSPLLYPMMKDIFGGGQEYMQSQMLADSSASLNTVFLPSINHGLIGKYVRYWYVKHNLPIQWGIAGGAFIGYTVLFLCLYTVVKLRHVKPWFWLMAAASFLILAFGPDLMIFSKHYKWLPLPYAFFQRIPILKIARVPERFMVMVVFCCSVLAGYGCWDLLRRVRIRKILFAFLTIVAIFELFRFYYVTSVEEAPAFYKQLAQDHETYAILEITQLMNWVHPSVRASLFQITHGKKLFHGHVSRIPFETYQQAYALYTMFDDLFTQDRAHLNLIAGQNLSLGNNQQAIKQILSCYHVRYVTLYADYWFGNYQENRVRLQQLFGEPVWEQGGVSVFKVEQTPITENFVFPGFGMYALTFGEQGVAVRRTTRSADIKLLNVTQAQNVQLRFQGHSYLFPKEERVQIFVNNTLVTTETIGNWTEISIPPVAIVPGENTIKFRMISQTSDNWKHGMFLRNIEVTMF